MAENNDSAKQAAVPHTKTLIKLVDKLRSEARLFARDVADRLVIAHLVKGAALGILCSAYVLAREHLDQLYRFVALVLFGEYTHQRAREVLYEGPLPSIIEKLSDPVYFVPIVLIFMSCVLIGLWDGLRVKRMRDLLDRAEALNKEANEANLRALNILNKLTTTEKITATDFMAAGVVSEINDPLSNVSSSIQVLQEKADENMQEPLAEAKRDLDYISETIETFLSFSPARQMQEAEDFGRTSISAVLKEALSLQENHLKETNIKVETKFEENLPEVEGRQSQLVQGFNNMILNAVQAMGEGGTLTLRAFLENTQDNLEKVSTFFAPRRASDPPDVDFSECRNISSIADAIAIEDSSKLFIKIEVEDTGCGIPVECIPNIFEPFFTTREADGNAGLGLSKTYAIIQRHGGSIDLDSTVGEGSTFTVHLPVAGELREPCSEAQASTTGEENAAASQPSVSPPTGTNS